MGKIDEYSKEEQRSIFGSSVRQEVNLAEQKAELEDSGSGDFYSLFSTRTANILRQLQINSYAKLKTLTLYDLLHTRNAGPTTARELIDFIWNRLGK